MCQCVSMCANVVSIYVVTLFCLVTGCNMCSMFVCQSLGVILVARAVV